VDEGPASVEEKTSSELNLAPLIDKFIGSLHLKIVIQEMSNLDDIDGHRSWLFNRF